MCIRDRVYADKNGDGKIAKSEQINSSRKDALLAAAGYVDPVSYTHLGAHETVLDLVCRLLLEKKKRHTRT